MTEREWDKRLHIKTIGREDESSADCSPYEPTPYAVLERLVDAGCVGRRDHLLDYGCGKGRVACFMAHAALCRVTGIDYAQKLIDIAAQNRKASGTGDRVRLVCARAEQYGISEENVFFFFNPFSERIFAGVLRRIVESWYARPRLLKIICYYPSEAYLACLDAAPECTLMADIDCNDLFSGKNPRERLVIYALPDGK
ncbi:MAG: class I SAM-dependent methyltransferase [Clostridia bacterium]|nr:class I SAM-dependent methyltransferase [Clostridia bacterium]